MLAVLGLTQSRGAFVGLAVGFVAMLACLARRGWGRGQGLAVAAVVAAGVWGVGRIGLARLGELLFGGANIEAVGGINLAGRVEIWSRAIYAIQDFPFTGMGLNTFRRVVHVLYPLFLIGPDMDIAHAHNQFLQVALDLGLPGLVAYVALWIAAIVLLVRAWRSTRDLWLRAVTLGLAGSFVAYFVYGLADTVALGAKPGLAFWTLLALCVAVRNVAAQPAGPIAAAHLTSRPLSRRDGLRGIHAEPIPAPEPVGHFEKEALPHGTKEEPHINADSRAL
jgi:putative inorganic carbon (HCO3(-)) transporter